MSCVKGEGGGKERTTNASTIAQFGQISVKFTNCNIFTLLPILNVTTAKVFEFNIMPYYFFGCLRLDIFVVIEYVLVSIGIIQGVEGWGLRVKGTSFVYSRIGVSTSPERSEKSYNPNILNN